MKINLKRIGRKIMIQDFKMEENSIFSLKNYVKYAKIVFDVAKCCIINLFSLISKRENPFAFCFTYSSLTTQKY